MTTRADIVAEALSWKGTPWHHQASKKGVGADCARGLVVGVARELGLPEAAEFEACPEFKGYGREPDVAMILAACERFLDPASLPLQAGDILFLRVPRAPLPMHFAILTKPNQMIHSTISNGKVVVHRLDEVWRSRIARVFCYRGIDG